MNNRMGKENHNILKAYNMLLYFGGTMIMWDPSNECIHDFWTQGMIKSLPVSSHNPRFIKAASQLRSSINDEASRHDRMKDDYLSLFTGTGTPLAPPYESVYKYKHHHLQGKQHDEVRVFYRSYGWESRFKNKLPDDHLGIELLFLTLMIEKYLEMDDDVSRREMRSEIRRFINTHLLSWVPQWNDDIQKSSSTMSYKGIGTLIHACIEDLYSIMEGFIEN